MTGIILAGGRGERISLEKPFIEIGGKKIIERTVDLFSRLFDEIIIVTNSPEKYSDFGVILTPDVILGKGPLMGIYSGLLRSSGKYNFVAACDMPFIQSGMIAYMKDLVRDYDLIVPEVDGYYEPLHAIYSKDCIEIIGKLAEKGIFKVQNLLKTARTRAVVKDEIVKYDPHLISFININNNEDMIRAEKIAASFP